MDSNFLVFLTPYGCVVATLDHNKTMFSEACCRYDTGILHRIVRKGHAECLKCVLGYAFDVAIFYSGC